MTARTLLRRAGLLALLALTACDEATGAFDPVRAEYPIIYGTDDRREVYVLTDPGLLALAASTVALVDSADVSPQGDGTYLVNGAPTLGVARRLCSGEPFADQPTAAFCTGFLVSPDRIATAGHCIDASSCGSTTFVFGYQMLGAATPRLQFAASDVFTCAQVVDRVQSATNDWAVVRLDRAVTDREPLALRRTGAVALGAPVVVAGHPSGLPLKVAGNAAVQNAAPADYFEANVDAYGGNSGSPVVDATTLEVEGILVRGNTDYTYVRKRGCYVSNVCPDTGCPGWEEVTRAAKFAALVPIPCEADAGCADADACTTDTCGSAGTCVFTPVVCPTGLVCTNGTCQAPTCAAVGQYCASNAACCSGKCNLAKHKCR